MARWETVAAAAKAQFGLVTFDQLRALGLSRAAVVWAVQSGRLQRRRRGVFAVPGASPGWKQRACEALLVVGRDAVLSHDSAAHLWGLDGFERPPAQLAVTAPQQRRPPHLPGVDVLRTTRPREARVVCGLRASTVAQTLVDLAGVLDEERLEVALDSAHRKWPRVGEWIEALLSGRDPRGVPGQTRLLELVRERRGVSTESALEVRVWRRLRRARGLKQPRLQYDVFDDGGFVMRVDFAWLAERVAVHVDGYQWHDGRRRFDLDVEQRNRLKAAGWECLTVTSATLDTPWLDALRELLRSRAPQRELSLEVPDLDFAASWMP